MPPTAATTAVCAIVGKDRFLRREALEEVLRMFGAEVGTLGPTRHEGASAGLSEVLDDVRTMSLLGDRRVVVVDDADDFITEHRSALERYCSAPADTGCLIFLCNSLPKNTKLHKIISGKGVVVDCEAPKGRAVVTWIVRRAHTAYGKRISDPAASRLRERIGDVLGTLDSELAKLADYVGQGVEISAADVDELTGFHREETVFSVTDALASEDVAGALRLWEQVLATDRAAPGRAIAGLAWAVRRLLEAKRDWENGVSVRELSARMYTNADVLKRRLDRVTTRQLERQLADLLAADVAVKTGASAFETAVEKFIVLHATGKGKSS